MKRAQVQSWTLHLSVRTVLWPVSPSRTLSEQHQVHLFKSKRPQQISASFNAFTPGVNFDKMFSLETQRLRRTSEFLISGVASFVKGGGGGKKKKFFWGGRGLFILSMSMCQSHHHFSQKNQMDSLLLYTRSTIQQSIFCLPCCPEQIVFVCVAHSNTVEHILNPPHPPKKNKNKQKTHWRTAM